MIRAHGGWITILTSEAKTDLAALGAKKQHCCGDVWHAGRPMRVTHTERKESAREYFSTFADHRTAAPGPEKSTDRIYRFSLDWLSRICTPINTFTALLMSQLGINKVTVDEVRRRFSWQPGRHGAE